MRESDVINFERRQSRLTRQRAVNVLWDILGILAVIALVYAAVEWGK
jgi:hypothetical protein